MKAMVFYSWQSDTRAASNRTLIQGALETAVINIARDGSVGVEPVVDRDTENVAGAPDIGATILGKIRAASVVVADVTIINQGSNGRLTPDPNVMIEVGYALAVHGDSRLILVQNLAFGRREDLPFDLRQKRVLGYESPANAAERATQRRALQATLVTAIGAVLGQNKSTPLHAYPCRLSMGYKTETQTSDLHEYTLRVNLENVGAKRIDDWHVDIEIPTPLLKKGTSVGVVGGRSNKERTLFRFNHESDGRPIFPGDTRTMEVPYRVNDQLFEKHGQILDQSVKATSYIHDDVGDSIERPARDLQHF